MLTKAYVEEIVDDYKVRVRIPIFDKLSTSPGGTPTEQLSISPICTIPGGKYNYSVGDIVFVTFEDNDLGRPVILGQLYADIDNKGLASLSLDGLEVLQSAVLPENTTIGNVPPSSIKNLSGIRSPIQQQIDAITGNVTLFSSSNPYMNTILQNFMDAHYVVLPNGDYIVDSFLGSGANNVYKDGGTHYFYEFAQNVLTEEEETPIYNQNELQFKIDLPTAPNPWDISGKILSDAPVYVVFDSELEHASLYSLQDGTGDELGQKIFKRIEGTQVDLSQTSQSETSPEGKTNVHGNKNFWELLLSNYTDYYVIPGTQGQLPEDYQTRRLYTTGDDSGTNVPTDCPWSYDPVHRNIYVSPSLYGATIGKTAVVYITDTNYVSGTVLYNSTNKYLYINANIPQGTTSISGITFKDTGDYGDTQFAFLISYVGLDGEGEKIWSPPIVISIVPSNGYKIQDKDILIQATKNSFTYFGYSVSNVLQMIGLIAFSLSGVDVQGLYGTLMSGRPQLNGAIWKGYEEGNVDYVQDYLNIPNAIDRLWQTMYSMGDLVNDPAPEGVVWCRDILMAPFDSEFNAFGKTYKWTQALYDSTTEGEIEVLQRLQ